MAQNQYNIAKRLLQLIELVDAGELISEEIIRQKFGVKRSCAKDYLDFVHQVRKDLETLDGPPQSWRRRSPGQQVRWLQAMAFELGAIQLEFFTGSQVHRELVELARTFRERLEPTELERLDRLTRSFYRRPLTQPGLDAKVLDPLIDALTHRHCCRVQYEPLDRAIQSYHLEPCRLIHYHDNLYLLARKLPGGEMRTFALDGIRHLELDRNSHFPLPPPHELNLEKLFRHSVGIHLGVGAPETVRLRVRGAVAALLRRRPIHPSQQTLEPDGDGWTLVSMTVRLCPELETRIMGMLPDVQVLAPTELQMRIADRLAAVRFTP